MTLFHLQVGLEDARAVRILATSIAGRNWRLGGLVGFADFDYNFTTPTISIFIPLGITL